MKINVVSSCASVAALSLTALAAANFSPEIATFGGAYTIDLKTGAIAEDKGGSADKAASTVYDSTNYVTSGATGYGVAGTSSTDLASVYGDSLNMTGSGAVDSFKFTLFCSSSSTGALVSATETIRFYRQSDNSFIGGFSTSVAALAKGFYATYTVTGITGLTLDTSNVIVTQQLSNVVGSSRMGTVYGTVANAVPAIGTTTAGMYLSNSTTGANFYTFTGYATNSNGVYQVNTTPVPAPGAAALVGLAGIITGRRRR